MLGPRPDGNPHVTYRRGRSLIDLSQPTTKTRSTTSSPPTLTRQFEAEQALINGDPRPRLALTSTQDPVTVFGANCRSGAAGMR